MSSDMEAVNSFNAELQSLYDVKPPISKGKMTAITRAALKAVKLYKHAVQSVEKFIQKCKAEYKIPGLYVIDSIIRQSRHQFGAEKDVFAPRFSRNIQNTFVHLYRCPEEDKAKVIRVLNLWQKNRIFSPEVIQPLFDLADPQNPIWEQIQNSNPELALGGGGGGSNNVNSGGTGSGGGGGGGSASGNNNSQGGFPSSIVNNLPAVHFNKKLLDFDYGEDDDGGGGGGSGGGGGGNSKNSADNTNVASSNPGLDALGSILSNPEILRQLQTLQEQMAAAAAVQQHQQMGSNYANTPEQERQRKLAELSKQEAAFDQRLAETVARLPFAKDCDLPMADDSTPKRGDIGGSSSSTHFSRDHHHGVDQNSNQLSNHTNPNVLLPPPFFQQLSEQTQQQQHHQHQQNSQQQQQQQLLNLFRNSGGGGGSNSSQNPFSLPLPFPIQGVPPPFPPGQQQDVPQNMGLFSTQPPGMDSFSTPFSQQPPPHLNNNQNQITINKSIFVEEIDLCDDTKEEDPLQMQLREQQRSGDLQRGRSKRSRSHERHKSGRSPAGSRTRRSRSRSRDRGRKRYRSRSRERREEREKEKERLRKGLPIIKKEHLSVCSTTLWVGHLSKLVSQEEISDTFGAYGDVVSIDLIPPRGCAFIVMNRRQDAVRALDRLKNTKLQGKTITLAWAPGKGVKGKEWKDYWEVTDGVSYIPWNKLRDETNLEEFEDGGCMDEDTLPDFLKNKPQPPESKSMDQNPPLPADNENSEDSMAMLNPPLPPQNAPTQMQGLLGNHSGGGIPSLLDPSALAAVGGKPSDTDARGEGGVPPPNPVAPPMPPGPFGMGPSVGMMPMGMNLMVPPPMLAMPGFQGMATLPGMPNMPMMGQMGMGMVPPGMPNPHAQHQHQLQHPHQHQPHPGMGAPGLLGDIPGAGPPPPNMAAAIQQQQQQMQQQQQQQQQMQMQNNDSLNNSLNNEESSSSDLITEEVKPERGGRGKKRSRFDDPEEKMMMSPTGENSMDVSDSPTQGDRLKDERPVFERLKSLAEGILSYGFGNDKVGPGPATGASLLGTPPLGPRAGPGGVPAVAAAAAAGIRPLFGDSRPPPRPQQTWFGDNNENPFLNPNPSNPFAGNPFIQSNLSENPFEIGSSRSDANPFAQNDRGGFGGGHRGGWSSRDGGDNAWGGGGRGGRGRGGRGAWRGGGGRGGWSGNNSEHGMEELENDLESRDSRGFRGRGGRGGRDNVWGRSGGDKDSRRDRPRSREDRERGRRGRGSRSRSPNQHRDSSGNRRRRSSIENNEEGGERRSHSGNREERRERDRERSHRPRSRHRSGGGDNPEGGGNSRRSRRDSFGDGRSSSSGSHWQSKYNQDRPHHHNNQRRMSQEQQNPNENWEGEGEPTVPPAQHQPNQKWGDDWENETWDGGNQNNENIPPEEQEQGQRENLNVNHDDGEQENQWGSQEQEQQQEHQQQGDQFEEESSMPIEMEESNDNDQNQTQQEGGGVEEEQHEYEEEEEYNENEPEYSHPQESHYEKDKTDEEAANNYNDNSYEEYGGENREVQGHSGDVGGCVGGEVEGDSYDNGHDEINEEIDNHQGYQQEEEEEEESYEQNNDVEESEQNYSSSYNNDNDYGGGSGGGGDEEEEVVGSTSYDDNGDEYQCTTTTADDGDVYGSGGGGGGGNVDDDEEEETSKCTSSSSPAPFNNPVVSSEDMNSISEPLS
ncbi:unnamed protein product [Orchesella dallaii]|uniref:Splicing factor, arginine/serine-rich 15 n=1 Tax=Orchesella dallaii TaxID=48710 RepID=A0ABP1RLF1_9HEXA